MSKSSFDRKIREAATPLLATDEDIEAIFVAQKGIGYWPLLLGAAPISFLINISLPDSFGQSLASASVFGLAFFSWFSISPAHGIVLTDRRVLFFPMTLMSRIQGPPFEEPRSGLRTAGPPSGWGWLKMRLNRDGQDSIRLNIASPWRREAEALSQALGTETDSPGSEASK